MYLLQAACSIAALMGILRLWSVDLRVPLNYFGDGLYVLSNVIAVIETGWFWTNPLLSAPFSLPLISFPSNNSVDHAFVWLFSRFTSSPGLVMNLTWLAFFPLTAAAALWCLRLLGLSRLPAAAAGLLYSFLPFVFFHGPTHLMLSYYLVPFAATLAIVIGANRRVEPRQRTILLAGTALLGFNFIYNAAFAVIMLAAALLIAALGGYIRQQARSAVIAVLLIAACSALNLAPSFYSWQKTGRPEIDYKEAREADVYGMKIRHLLGPVPGHTFAPFANWSRLESDARFPYDPEDMGTARLGVVLAAGFLGLLAILLMPLPERWPLRPELLAASRLGLLLLLVAVPGGLGSVFNLLVRAEIRAYNRSVVYLAFFCVLVVGAFWHWLLDRLGSRPALARCAVAAMAVLAILDQSAAARPMMAEYRLGRDRAPIVEDAVRHLERLICSSCAVYQLPETPFPVEAGTGAMPTYDHGKPQLYSRTLRWSWPAFTPRRLHLGAKLDPQQPEEFLDRLAIAGFGAIWLDRAGYEKGGQSPEPGIQSILGAPSYVSRDGRYALFDLRSAHAKASALPKPQRDAIRSDLLDPVTLTWGSGFYAAESLGSPPQPFRWSDRRSELVVQNFRARSAEVVLRGSALSGTAPPSKLIISYGAESQTILSSTAPTSFEVRLLLEPMQSVAVRFHFGGPRVDAPKDRRRLYFGLLNTRLETR